MLVVDVANVLGSRPDGWWRDRVGATSRLLDQLSALAGREVCDPRGLPLALDVIVAVVEGQARSVVRADDAGLMVLRAPRDADAAIVDCTRSVADPGSDVGEVEPGSVLVVTADRELRRRLPAGCAVAGPRWLLALVDG
jgi:hypothetical protein